MNIRTIYCIGRNYAAHARELKNEVPAEPVVFLKPVSSLTLDGGRIEIPRQSQRVDHEVELVVLLGEGAGRDMPVDKALASVAAYGVGIDVTARDLQEEAKKKALPWTVAKGFDTFTVLGNFIPAASVADPSALQLELSVNGVLRQQGSTQDMLFPVPALITYLSGIFTLAPGDLIFTGTPAGVAPLHEGDQVAARLKCGSSVLSFVNVAVKKRAGV